jgi:translation initiation factor IF-3
VPRILRREPESRYLCFRNPNDLIRVADAFVHSSVSTLQHSQFCRRMCKAQTMRTQIHYFTTQAQTQVESNNNDDNDTETNYDDDGNSNDKNDATSSKSLEDLFNLDDDSWELPPNPDIPPPKTRIVYPPASTPREEPEVYKLKSRQKPSSTISSLANERLVAQIMNNMKRRQQQQQQKSRHNGSQNNTNAITADSIQVRVVPDPLLSKRSPSVESTKTKSQVPPSSIEDMSPRNDDDNDDDIDDVQSSVQSTKASENTRVTTKVMSLSEAIQLSIDQRKDLVEVSIDQDVPVVTVSSLTGIAYQSVKAKKGNKAVNAASTQVKEVTMQAGIALNDLQRKVNDIVKFLDKGHTCIVTIRAGRRLTNENEHAAMEAVRRVLPLLEDKIEMIVPPEVNPLKSVASFRVRAKKK